VGGGSMNGLSRCPSTTRSRSCRCEAKRKVTMYAVMMRVRVDDLQKAVEQLERDLIPVIQSAPGFRTGIWLSPDVTTGEGLSFVVFDDESQAQQAAEMARSSNRPGETPLDVQTVEVIAIA
jgi:hypothetical protein